MDHGDLIGATLAGTYLIEDRLGSGGMGAVYRARHVVHGYAVAVKVLRSELSEDVHELKRFQREARAASSLSHLNVAQVTDIQQDQSGLVLMVMELVEGRSLMEILESEGLLTQERTAALMQQVLSALATAHEAGIVHRDVKPSNIMVATIPGQAELIKLLDFGIAKMLDGAAATKLTKTGVTLGTPHYMPSEQVFGRGIDHRVDLYAVGVILYEALSGKMPFEFKGMRDFVVKITTETPRSLAEVAPDLPPEVVASVDRAISPSADDRYQSAQEMSAALSTWTRQGQSSRPVSREESAAQPEKESWTSSRGQPFAPRVVSKATILVMAMIFGVVLFALAVITGLLIATWIRPEPETPAGGENSPALLQPSKQAIATSSPRLPTPLRPPIFEEAELSAGVVTTWNFAPPRPMTKEWLPDNLKSVQAPLIYTGFKVEEASDFSIEATKGEAIIVKGLGRLTFRNCVIKGEIGLLIEGGAHVELHHCWVEGTTWGVRVRGGGMIKFIGGAIVGPGDSQYRRGAVAVTGTAKLMLSGTQIKGIVMEGLGAKIVGHQ